jgi:hypothetical protein
VSHKILANALKDILAMFANPSLATVLLNRNPMFALAMAHAQDPTLAHVAQAILVLIALNSLASEPQVPLLAFALDEEYAVHPTIALAMQASQEANVRQCDPSLVHLDIRDLIVINSPALDKIRTVLLYAAAEVSVQVLISVIVLSIMLEINASVNTILHFQH